jgi:catalase-peroxidase
VPSEELIWQDPVPTVDHKLIDSNDIKNLKRDILSSGLTVPELIRTAWASAASFRASDKRGGANGARIMLAPQKDWEVNNPDELQQVLNKLQTVQTNFNRKARSGKKVSMADMIVLAGAAAVEKAASDAGAKVSIPFTPGRTDATQAQTDITSFSLLEPKADAFRNYFNKQESYRSPAEMLVDKADQLNLTVPEMTALIGGLRVLGANADNSTHGVFTDRVGTLSNDFFVNLLDMSTVWRKSSQEGLYEGFDRKSGRKQYTATTVDLVFGSNSELRAIAEVYAYDNAKQKFAEDFAKAWHKVMQLDRFDLRHQL